MLVYVYAGWNMTLNAHWFILMFYIIYYDILGYKSISTITPTPHGKGWFSTSLTSLCMEPTQGVVIYNLRIA